ncbi:hypothetical protein HanIR_Chr04g0169081 [Helianthus annuus]|nr:hypothetical protein HanIR_Chr04g0169081 [Helianthus annuus]
MFQHRFRAAKPTRTPLALPEHRRETTMEAPGFLTATKREGGRKERGSLSRSENPRDERRRHQGFPTGWSSCEFEIVRIISLMLLL